MLQEQELAQIQTALEVKIIQTQEHTPQAQTITITVAILDHHQTVITVAEVEDHQAVEVTVEEADHLAEVEDNLFSHQIKYNP